MRLECILDHLESVKLRIRSAAVSSPNPPWTVVARYAVGGLTEVGFSDDSEYLLAVSSRGRGVYECRTGEQVARDYSEPNETWYDERNLRADAIDPIAGEPVRLAGLIGGGLPNIGPGGWWADAITLDWPDTSLLLGGPGGWIYDDNTPFVKVGIEREVRAFGFSWSGESLVLATSSDLAIFRLLAD